MQIVHVVRQFHPAMGGLEGVVDSLSAEQVANGHRVRRLIGAAFTTT